MASRSSSKRPRLEFVGSRSRRRRGRGGSSGLLIAQPRRRDPGPVLAVLALLLVVAGGVAAWVLLRHDGKPGPRRPSAASYHSTLGASVVGFDLDSRLLRRTLHPVGVVPAGKKPAAGRPLLVLLHAHGMPPDFFLTDGLFRALRAAGPRAPAVVAVDGGSAPSFWHDRRSGAWASMVLREAIPSAARELGADPRRVAIGGVAMGGFGALDLGRRSPRRFCAVGARSPAIFAAAKAAPAGAFDSAADFRRHDLIRWATSLRRPYGETPVWIDAGRSDPLRKSIGAFVAQVPRAVVHRWKGGRDAAYWRGHDQAFTTWMIRALARCAR